MTDDTSALQAALLKRAHKTRRRQPRRVTVRQNPRGVWLAWTNYGLTGAGLSVRVAVFDLDLTVQYLKAMDADTWLEG